MLPIKKGAPVERGQVGTHVPGRVHAHVQAGVYGAKNINAWPVSGWRSGARGKTD